MYLEYLHMIILMFLESIDVLCLIPDIDYWCPLFLLIRFSRYLLIVLFCLSHTHTELCAVLRGCQKFSSTSQIFGHSLLLLLLLRRFSCVRLCATP